MRGALSRSGHRRLLDTNRPLLDKLGIKPGQLTLVLGLDDAEFLAQLKELGAAKWGERRRERRAKLGPRLGWWKSRS